MSLKKDVLIGLIVLLVAGAGVGAFLLFSGPSVDDLVREARTAEDQGNWQQAYSLYERAEEREPGNLDVRIALARVTRQLGRLDEARAYVQSSLQVAPQDPEALIQAGLIEIEAGDFEDSSAYFTRLLDLQPANADGLAGLGRCQYELGRARAEDFTLTRGLLGETKAEILQQALQNLERALQGEPTDPLAALRYRCLCLLELGQPEAALPIAESLVRQAPEDGLNHHVLAMVHLEMDNLQPALQSVQTAFEKVRALPDQPAKYRHLAIVMAGFGRVQYELGQYDQAVENFIIATRNDRHFVDAHLHAAATYALLGQHEQAIEWLQKARGVISARGGREGVAANEPALILYRMANEAQRLRQTDRALALLRKTVELAPDFAQGLYAIAAISLQAGDESTARQYLRAALAKDPEHLDAAYDLGALLIRDGLAAQAADQFRKVLALNPDSPDIHLSLAEAYRRMGETDKANQHYEEARRLAPNDPDVLVRLAYALDVQGNPDEALAKYNQVLDLAPNSPDVHARLALFYLNHGEPAEAVARIQKAMDLNPDARKYTLVLGDARFRQALDSDGAQTSSLLRQAEAAYQESMEEAQGVLRAEALIGHANVLLAMGRAEDAIARYDEALELQVDRLTRAVAEANKAHAQYRNNNPIEALNLAMNAVKLSPEMTLAHYNLGCIFAGRNNWNSALQYFRSATEHDQNHAQAAYNLGVALMEARRQGEARDVFRANIEKGRTVVDSYINLAAMEAEAANWREAQDPLRLALQEDRDSLLALGNTALVLLRQDKDREARESADRAVTVLRALDRPTLEEKRAAALAYQVRGILYAREQAWQDAQRELEAAVELAPETTAEALVNLGHVLLEQSQYTRAQALYERALQKLPEDPVVLNGLGDLYAQTGEYEKAREMLNRSLAQRREQPEVLETVQRIESLLNSSWLQEEG